MKKHIHNATDIYTGRIQYFPSFVDWHIVRLPWVTHPTVSLQEEVTTLPVAVGVWGFINNFEDGLPRDKTVHSLWLVNFIWTVAMEELPYCQRSGTVRHSSVQTSIAIKTLQAFGDIWLTDKPRCQRSSRFREFKGNLRPALNTCSYTPRSSTPS